jgi:hypothetical protein
MRKTAALRVQEALILFNIPMDKQREIMNAAFGLTASATARLRPKTSHIAQSWVSTIEPLHAQRRILSSNSRKWPADLRPVYEKYLALIDAVLMKMRAAAESGTLADETARIALVNAERKKDGRPSLGARDKRWQSWVPPHIRTQITEEFEIAYIKAGRTKGNRMTPFVTHAIRAASAARAERLKASIKLTRNMHRTPYHTGDYAHTPYRALYMAAARMAERTLAQLVIKHKQCKANVYDAPIPVNWKHLLTPEMRKRLDAADKNPDATTLDGIESFFYPLKDADGSAAPIWEREDAQLSVSNGGDDTINESSSPTGPSDPMTAEYYEGE